MTATEPVVLERTLDVAAAAPLVASWLMADLPAADATVRVSDQSTIILDLPSAPTAARAAVMRLLEQPRFAGWVVTHLAT